MHIIMNINALYAVLRPSEAASTPDPSQAMEADMLDDRTATRTLGSLLALAGLLAGAALPFHPNEFAAGALLDPRWVPVHAALLVSFALSVPGVVGRWFVQRHALATWGHAAFLVATVGCALSVAMVAIELCVLPGIAIGDPRPMMELTAPGGAYGGTAALFGVGFLAWIPGWMAAGIATHQARVLARPLGLAITCSAVAVAVPVHFVGGAGLGLHAVTGVAFGAAWLGLGVAVAGGLSTPESRQVADTRTP